MPGKEEIFFGDSSFIMRGERQFHLVKTNINIRMMIDFLSSFGDSTHKGYARHEIVKLERAANGFRAFRPIRNGRQVKVCFFGRQGWHNFKFIFVSPEVALCGRG